MADELRGSISNNLGPTPALCLHCKAASNLADSLFCCQACEELYKLGVTSHSATEKTSFQQALKKYSYLDLASFKSRYVFNDHQMLFYIEGLSCTSCVHLLERLPEYDDDILESRIHFGDSTLLVRLQPHGTWASVVAMIEEWGYKAIPLSPEENSRALYQQENRDLLKRVGVAAACAGNMMLFVIPVYAGLEGVWRDVFNWASFFLFLPILFYSAKPFYQGALNFLKYRAVNIDLPIVVAFTAGFSLSTYNLLQGHGEIYFDSTASFLFLILFSRYLQKYFQQKYLNINAYQPLVSPDVNIGATIEVQQGQQIPVDGRLMSPVAEVDLSLFNGESLPQTFHKNMKVFAGSTLLSPSAMIRVEAKGTDTQWGKLIRALRSEAVKKSAFVGVTDRLAQKLVIFVFSVAFFYLLWNIQSNPQQALQRSLALIVVACPCALAFGTPLAYGLALKKAKDLGIIIKNADVFEKIHNIKNIFLDKTGTLTEGQLAYFGTEGTDITFAEKQIILSLESTSYHPIAFALRKAWSDSPTFSPPGFFCETIGRGVEGFYDPHFYSLTSSTLENQDDQIVVEFRKDKELIHRLIFRDQVREDSKSVIAALSSKYNLHILSGDKQKQTRDVARDCGIDGADCHAELSPQDKHYFLKNTENSCMIGDGANDALALQSADIGIAVKGSTGLSLMAADVYFSKGGLSPLLDLISISKQLQKTVQRNLVISLVYNISGAVLALSGFINPMVAAILMPISSILILISSLRGLR